MKTQISAQNFDQLARTVGTRRSALKGMFGLALGIGASRISAIGADAKKKTITVTDGLALECVEGCADAFIEENSPVSLDDYSPFQDRQVTDNGSEGYGKDGCFGEDCGHPLTGPKAYTSGTVVRDAIAAAQTGENSNVVYWHARIPEEYVLLLDGHAGHVAGTTYHWAAGGVAAIEGPNEIDLALVDGSLWMVHDSVAKVRACTWWVNNQGNLHGRLYLPEEWGNVCNYTGEPENEFLTPGDPAADVYDGADFGLDMCEDGDCPVEEETAIAGECVTFDVVTPIRERTLVCKGMTVAAGSVELSDGTYAEGCYITLAENAYVTDGVGASLSDDLQDEIDGTPNGQCVFASA